MRIFSLSQNDLHFIGIEDDHGMVDLSRAVAFYETVVEGCTRPPVEHIEELMLEDRLSVKYLGEVMEAVERHNLRKNLGTGDNYTVEPPVYPGKIIALGQNYLAHIREMNLTVPDEPVLFGKWPSCVIGHNDPIMKPSWIGRMDYEAELAVVIGRDAWHVPAEKAMDYVAGYTCLNDVTARDMQARHMASSSPWMLSKNFETAAPMGPCLLLRETVAEPVALSVQARVNGELRQDGNTSDFIFDIPTIIAYISKIMKLETGDVITTGTPMGVGPIKPGDIIEITCGDVGTLSNPVVALAASDG